MNIILRVVNRLSGKEIFIDEKLLIHNKEDFFSSLRHQRANNLFLVNKNGKVFVKSKPNTDTSDNITNKSISYTELISFYKNYRKATDNQKTIKYDFFRRTRQKAKPIIVRDDNGDFVSTKTLDEIRNHLKKHKNIILEAAKKQKIDPCILGAILIDEYCRTGWDDWLDWLGALNVKNTSIGITQIKLSTAREIIKRHYYNPAPGKISEKSPSIQISYYLYQSEHSIQFAAAAIRLSIDYWHKKKIDILKKLKVLAYLYSAGYAKNIRGAAKKRPEQISTEFYQIAKEILP